MKKNKWAESNSNKLERINRVKKDMRMLDKEYDG